MGNDTSTCIHSTSALRFQFSLSGTSREVGNFVLSDVACDLNNNSWQLGLYPGGLSTGSDGLMSLCLMNTKNPTGMKFQKFSFAMRAPDGSVCHEVHCECRVFDQNTVVALTKLNFQDHGFEVNAANLPRVEGKKFVLEKFVTWRRGDLVIDVVIGAKQMVAYNIPSNPLSKNLLRMLETGHKTDVAFEVEGDVICAHRFILDANAPFLATLCRGCTKESPAPMQGIAPNIFRRVLRYIYGEIAPNFKDEVMAIGTDLIDAANRCGLIDLKLEMESYLAEFVDFNVSNVADYILFADSMTCPLLKERAVSFFIARAKDVLKSESSSKLNESADLMKELMIAILDADDKMFRDKNDELMSMSVDQLRNRLDHLNMDMDGSKELLVSRLHSNCK